MREPYHHKKFTPEQIARLAENPFTSEVDFHRIRFTLEFQNIFLSRYEQGETSKEIFESLGYSLQVLGPNRIYNYPRYLYKRLKNDQGLTETAETAKLQAPAKVDYNTLPSQQSVSAMQREIAYLRQQIEFLKKITELDNDRKPRT